MTAYSPEYVSSLERRIVSLESEMQNLRETALQVDTTVDGIKGRLPTTSLMSPNFLARAFTVWGTTSSHRSSSLCRSTVSYS